DFNDRSEPTYTQTGFQPFVLNGGPEVQTDPTTRLFGDIDVTVSDASGGEGFQDRHRSGGPGNLGAFTESQLLSDFIFSNNRDSLGLDVTIGGLLPGEVYTLTAWSYDEGSGGSDRVSDWTANGVLAAENYL